jgi:hypothetical protein
MATLRSMARTFSRLTADPKATGLSRYVVYFEMEGEKQGKNTSIHNYFNKLNWFDFLRTHQTLKTQVTFIFDI